jgi:hypothetical protein
MFLSQFKVLIFDLFGTLVVRHLPTFIEMCEYDWETGIQDNILAVAQLLTHDRVPTRALA